MLRTLAVLVVVVVSMTAIVAHAQTTQTTQPARPNIVLFIADDLSVADTAPYGNAKIPTPNMTALATSGLTFDRAYATSPSCAPSRAALLTGRYNRANGVMFNHQRVHADMKKWPAYFQSLGYEVVAIGKVSHYGHVQAYGFDHAAFYNYHEDVCIDEAVEWLDARRSDKPLCLLVGTNFPHVPWPEEGLLAPRDVPLATGSADTPRTRRARTRYVAAVNRADSDLGKIRAAARQHLPADTMFIFTADQGSQWPFAKWNLYEAGIRVPLIVSWPGHVVADRRTGAMVSWVDLMPTLLEAAGEDPTHAASELDGRSFMPVLAGQADAHRDRVFATHSGDGSVNYYPSRAVRMGNWKYIRNLDPALEFHTHVDLLQADTGYFGSWVEQAKTDPATAAIVNRYHHRPAEELYDLAADPDEQVNRAADASHRDDLVRLRGALDEWMHANHDDGLATDQSVRPKPETP